MANAYWQNIRESFKTLSGGLRLTFRHLKTARKSPQVNAIMQENYFDSQDGLATIQYPHESIPIPDNGRYRLHNEIDDCIVCDKCAKICPVDCIDIEAIRSPEVFGTTSDGTAKRIYAAKFDIDMGKCCFCGLCTTVCPTECLTMTKTYDFSEFDIDNHVYEFAAMTPLQILEKKQAWDEHQAAKQVGLKAKKEALPGPSAKPNVAAKPVLKPKTDAKPQIKPKVSSQENKTKPVVPKPKMPAKPSGETNSDTKKTRPVIRPKPIIRKKPPSDE